MTKTKTACSALAPVLGLLFLAACSNPSAGSTEYKQGALGNGGFLFECDDSVACDRWSNDAKKFPQQISTGSTFKLRFVANDDQGEVIGNQEYPGSTLQAVPPYVSSGPDGFVMLKPGYGTVTVRDSRGVVIDYVTLHIMKPDTLVVYDAAYHGDNPTAIESISIAGNGIIKTFRTVAMKGSAPLAGSVQVEWTSSDPSVVTIQGLDRGVAILLGVKAGTATVTAAGAALSKAIKVTVAGGGGVTPPVGTGTVDGGAK